MIDSALSPSYLLGNQSHPSLWLVPQATRPNTLVLSKSHLNNINPIVVETGLLRIRYPFHLYDSEIISRIEAKLGLSLSLLIGIAGLVVENKSGLLAVLAQGKEFSTYPAISLEFCITF